MTPTIGERIATVRRSQRLTQRQLGAKCGLTAPTIFNIEKDYTVVQPERLRILCKALGIKPSDILSDDWRIRCQRGGISLEEPIA